MSQILSSVLSSPIPPAAAKLQTHLEHPNPRLFSSRKNFWVQSAAWSCTNLVEYSTATLKKQQQRRSLSSHGRKSSCLLSGAEEEIPGVEVVVISEENIKPTAPTPHNLRNYKLSLLDQITPDVHPRLLLFYPNNQTAGGGDSDASTIVSERLEHLKLSLSQTLTQFYPFAGKIRDNYSISCNDEGVYYATAKVMNSCLSDFLSPPNTSLLDHLAPKEPYPSELDSGIHVVMIQVNTFSCGGIAICISASHKLMDGNSAATFVKAWAANARCGVGSQESVTPSYIAPSIFPQMPVPPPQLYPLKMDKTNKLITRRFVFDAVSLNKLKTKVAAATTTTSSSTSSSSIKVPTRVEVVSALIWKRGIAACRAIHGSPIKSSGLLFPVNLRRRFSPPLPRHSIGNIVLLAIAECNNPLLELPHLVDCLKRGITQVTSVIKDIKGDKGTLNVADFSNQWDEERDIFSLSSVCGMGFYEFADFGWGKPVWLCFTVPGLERVVFLADTRSGDGIEATVTLNEQEMGILETDPELLQFTSMDPSPLLL